MTLPTNSKSRKEIPIVTGVLDYFPDALAEVAKVSLYGSNKHNPGQPMHWERSKSTDEADAGGRHLMERGGIDPETGMLYSAEMCWRNLAFLQKECEERYGLPISRGSRWNGKTAKELAEGKIIIYPANTSADNKGIPCYDLPEVNFAPAKESNTKVG